MTSEIQDERYYVAEEAIHDSFFLLLKEKELNKITVSDVIKKAGIVRSTFYNHYENIPALVDTLETQSLQDIFSMMNRFHPKNDQELCKSFFKAICEYTQSNPFISNLISSPRSDDFFEKALTMFHQYVSKITTDTAAVRQTGDDFSYRIACTIGCTVGVLHKWTRDNCQTPTDTIAEILSQTFLRGILPFMEQAQTAHQPLPPVS